MTIRPQTFDEFLGQPKALERLRVAVAAALQLKRPLPHVLLEGGPGLGKTTCAAILAHEMGVEFKAINCASVERPQDLLPTLTTMRAGEVLFLDEIHALQGTGCFDYLLTTLEDSRISVKAGEGPQDPIITVDLPRFTIVGATTRAGKLPEPVRDRFPHGVRLELYSAEDMVRVLHWTAKQRGLELRDEAALELQSACHGTARYAVNLIEACRETLATSACPEDVQIDILTVLQTLRRLGYWKGLNEAEVRCLKALYAKTKALGLKTLAAVLDEDPQTVEDTVEPWLLQQGFIEKTPTGRVITDRGRELLREK